MAAQILVVEDEPGIQELVAVNLARAGHSVIRAASAEEAKVRLRATLPDLVLLDWVLPGMSGVDMARWMRSEPRTREVSLIMLTGRSEERDKIAGLESGADDYITKPFSTRELLARIAAVLRRRVPQATYDAVQAGGLRLEPVSQRVTAAGSAVSIGPMEFRLLHFLMTHPERIHSRAQLLDKVWGDHFFGDERTVDACVRRLRAALQEHHFDSWIRTARGAGYRFVSSEDA